MTQVVKIDLCGCEREKIIMDGGFEFYDVNKKCKKCPQINSASS